jgi:sugar phosphate permease
MQEKTNLLPHKGLDLQRLTRYRSWVYFVTFVAYANSHFSRKSYTNVKVQLKGSVGLDPILLSQMDTTFST